jgi:hypothetical protein
MLLKVFGLILVYVGLVSCGHTPVTLTLSEALGTGKQIDSIKLNPNFRYLRVTVNGRTLLMVLGYKDPDAEGAIETWYSSEGEVIQIQNGRILATFGLETDWRSVRQPNLPSWTNLLALSSVKFTRQLDQMPGFRYGIVQPMHLYKIPTPGNALLRGLSPSELIWYEEKVLDSLHGSPSARYGLRMRDGVAEVVYADQCLSKDFCFAWQIWPATP